MRGASKIIENIFNPNLAGAKKRDYLRLRVLLWCAFIFALSSVPNHTGRTVDFETLLGTLEFSARKLCHILEYTILMILTTRALEGDPGKPAPRAFILSFLFVLLFSSSDEWHQTFVFGRNGTPFDVFLDMLGALAGAFFCYWKDRRKRHEEKKASVRQGPARVEN